MGHKVLRSNCGMCHSGCGILAHVEDGELVKVEGDPDCPYNRGTLCAQGLAARQFVHHPDRLKYPMKRVGERGEGRWLRISWDEALDTIAQKVREIREKDGPLAVAVACGTARPLFPWVRRFTNILGTPNRLGYPHNCYSPMIAVGLAMYGADLRYDVEHSRCTVAWGYAITQSRPCREGRHFIEAYKHGCKVISVDPYFTPVSARSDLWLQIRPGTDCAMALAWLNVVIKEGLYNKEFVEKWTYGFDRLAEHIDRFTPEWAEGITWVSAEKIKRAARMYATTTPASVLPGAPTNFGTNSTNTLRSIWLLPAITGNLDVPGANIFWDRPYRRDQVRKMLGYDKMTSEVWEKSVGDFPLLAKAFPAAGHAGWRAVLTGKPYPIKAVMFHACNPLVGHENPRGHVYQAIKKLDLVSVMDHFMTPTGELADIVLPAATSFERDNVHHVEIGDVNGTFAAPKVIEPLWESRDDTDVFIEVLKRAGLDYGYSDAKEMLNDLLKPVGGLEELAKQHWLYAPQIPRKYEAGQLRADGNPGFNTATGKIELYSLELEKLGLDALPVYKEPPESPLSTPELLEDYPLVLGNGPRSRAFFLSQYRQVPWLRRIHSEPRVRIHPETAERYRIKDDDWVWIESPRGKCRQKAHLTQGVHPRVVLADPGWWFPERSGAEHGVWESNINLLTGSDPPFDPGTGSTPARSYLCKISRAEETQYDPMESLD